MRCLQPEHIVFPRAGADTTRGASDTPVAVNVTFRQNSGSGIEAFVAAANNMAQLMQDKGKDPVRALSVQETHLRTARVIRTSVQVSGAAGITQGPSAAPLRGRSTATQS